MSTWELGEVLPNRQLISTMNRTENNSDWLSTNGSGNRIITNNVGTSNEVNSSTESSIIVFSCNHESTDAHNYSCSSNIVPLPLLDGSDVRSDDRLIQDDDSNGNFVNCEELNDEMVDLSTSVCNKRTGSNIDYTHDDTFL